MINRSAIAATLLGSFALLVGLAGQQRYSVDGASTSGNRRDYQGGLAHALAWTNEEPHDASDWYYAGLFYGLKEHDVGLEQPDDAYEPLRHAVTLDPRFAEA